MIKIIQEEEKEFPYSELSLLVQSIFKAKGELELGLEFEHRQEQELMAKEVINSITAGDHLIFEAGTGVGKSLAYLIPSILFSVTCKRPCIVATNTINLQEQLLQKDIPAIRTLFENSETLSNYAGFSCALLVGRGNYLCSTRLNKALLGQGDLFGARDKKELERIAEWANQHAVEGIRQEMSPPPAANIWDAVNADSSVCSAKRCSPESCFYRRARLLVEKADLIIVNHSLLFSLIGAGIAPSNDADGIIFPNDFLIIDEAHEMPDQASEHLGISISSWAIENALRRVYNPAKRKGLLKKVGRVHDFEVLENAQHASMDFFNHIHSGILGEKERLRIREPNQIPLDLLPPLSRVSRTLIELGENSDDEATKIELLDQAKRFQGFIVSLAEIIEMKDADSVYWLERGGRASKSSI